MPLLPLFSGPARSGFAKALFRGEFRGDVLFPYPELPADERAVVEAAVRAVGQFADEQIDSAAIDRNDASIHRSPRKDGMITVSQGVEAVSGLVTPDPPSENTLPIYATLTLSGPKTSVSPCQLQPD